MKFIIKRLAKYLDKFLKLLKTDRNTFFTYILTLLTAYIVIDRIVELLILFFTGMSVSYWGPIKYTFALACPIFAFLFSYPSKFCKTDNNKVSFVISYIICLYIIAISAFVQWINHFSWLLLMSLPNYKVMITDFSDLIINAFTAIAIYIPIITFYKLFTWINKTIKDPIFPNPFQESISDFQGIDLSPADGTTGPYSLEIEICKDRHTGKPVKILENRRFYPTVIVGPSGTGKTSMLMEPLIARDLEKKYFFNEVAKEMGYTALKTNIAYLNKPYNNEYLNKNFNLNMLIPVEGKEKIYTAYMSKMIFAIESDDRIIYKNFGITTISPDSNHTDRIKEVAQAFNLPIVEIDPTNPNSIGLNPFIIGDPQLCGLIISLVIRGLYSPPSEAVSVDMSYIEDISTQAIQNLVILLKVMYPKLHDGLMPTLEDLLKCFTNFEIVEEMCEELKKDSELATTYELQLGYFRENFYKNSPGIQDMKKYIHFASSSLDVALRAAQVRNIICNRYNNINFNDVINDGKIVLISTRPFEIGGTAHKAFGKFFLMLMMCSVEGNRSALRNRTPHFLYVDEFDSFSPSLFADMFTLYRKFNIGTIYSFPNLASVGGVGSPTFTTLLSNASTKIFFGNSTPDEIDWWMQEFGKRREWKVGYSYDKEDGAYSSKLGGPTWSWEDHMKVGKIQGLKFKTIIYKIKNKAGKNVVNYGKVDFLESKYKMPHKTKNYNFNKYINNVDDTKKDEKPKWKPNKVEFTKDERGDINPIQTDPTDSSYFFDNADAISFNLGKKDNQ